MQLYQTETSKKRGMWHILSGTRIGAYDSMCRNGTHWVRGYHGRKPETHPEIVEWTPKHRLCPACVEQAYIRGKITIAPK